MARLPVKVLGFLSGWPLKIGWCCFQSAQGVQLWLCRGVMPGGTKVPQFLVTQRSISILYKLHFVM